MVTLTEIKEHIIRRINVNLREFNLDVGPHVRELIPLEQFAKFYAFYGVTDNHPLQFSFSQSSLSGSYFLGKCTVERSILYKSDIRGDELKSKGDTIKCGNMRILLHEDERISIKDSFLVRTLVHSNSHDPESPEEFLIQATVALYHANIHGSPIEGTFIGPFATVDLTTVHDSIIGPFCYVQTGELAHTSVPAGLVWIKGGNAFEFRYQLPEEVLQRYLRIREGKKPEGLFVDFVEDRKRDFEQVFASVGSTHSISVPESASLSRYAVVRGKVAVGENVLIAQRAYLEDSHLGKGANAQENCCIIRSHLEGFDITAHGGKIINSCLGKRVFVGFNAFLHGAENCSLKVGDECIVMPHTIIDTEEALEIPSRHLVWGCIRNPQDLAEHSMAIDNLVKVDGDLRIGSMEFTGSGSDFVKTFQHRIEHILEANGAFYDGTKHRGHAQRNQRIAFNILQPYPRSSLEGLYPTILITP